MGLGRRSPCSSWVLKGHDACHSLSNGSTRREGKCCRKLILFLLQGFENKVGKKIFKMCKSFGTRLLGASPGTSTCLRLGRSLSLPMKISGFLSPDPSSFTTQSKFLEKHTHNVNWTERKFRAQSTELCFSGPRCPIFSHVGLACSHGEPGDLEKQRCRSRPVSF